MKRILLLSAAALGVVAMSAQERDITPKNYKFYETSANNLAELGITDDEPCGAWNLDAYWWENHVKAVYNEGYLTFGGNKGQAASIPQSMIGIVDFGGTVGKALSISTPNSDINAAMAQKFGDIAPEVVIPTQNAGAHEWFWYFDGDNYPARPDGKYMRIRLQVNVFANTMKSGLDIGGNLYVNDNANNVRPGDDNASAGNPIQTTETTDLVEGLDEEFMPTTVHEWNPNKWCTIEWYFDCAKADDHSYGPKLKMNLGDEGSLVPYTLFIRKIELTEMDGECPALAPHKRSVDEFVADPSIPTSSIISSIEDEAIAPAVYYNLQGVRVANPENGIYIVKQGNSAKKVLVK